MFTYPTKYFFNKSTVKVFLLDINYYIKDEINNSRAIIMSQLPLKNYLEAQLWDNSKFFQFKVSNKKNQTRKEREIWLRTYFGTIYMMWTLMKDHMTLKLTQAATDQSFATYRTCSSYVGAYILEKNMKKVVKHFKVFAFFS